MQGHVASHLCRVRAAAWRTRRREGGPRETEQARGQGPKFGALLLLHARTMNRSCPSPPTFIFGCTGAPQKRLRESPRHFNKTRYSRERPASSLDRSFPNPLPKARHCTSPPVTVPDEPRPRPPKRVDPSDLFCGLPQIPHSFLRAPGLDSFFPRATCERRRRRSGTGLQYTASAPYYPSTLTSDF